MEIYVTNSRQAPSVELQAEVDLYHWRILQLDSGTLRIGAQMDSGSFRVTRVCRILCKRPIHCRRKPACP